jgi:phage shock protein PspC (stress-responsive transcriptional regulator)
MTNPPAENAPAPPPEPTPPSTAAPEPEPAQPQAETPPPPLNSPPPPPPPPPPGPGFNRQHLVRPVNGRYIAGVCAAIGRATNTDPVLWRVLFAVLTLAGGVGLLGYLVGWLAIPAEGDSASPIESMLGRGRSSTSTPLVITVGVLAGITAVFVVSNNVGPAIIGLAVIAGTVFLLVRGNNQSPQQPVAAPYGYPGMPPGPPPPFPYPSAPQPTATPGGPATPGMPGTPGPPGMPQPGTPPATYSSPFDPVTTRMPVVPAPATESPTLIDAPTRDTLSLPPEPPVLVPPRPTGPTAPPGSGYRPPFAPHGPYASSSPYAQSLGYGDVPPGGPHPPYPGLQPVPPRPPKPPRPKSKLGRITFSLLCLALGALAVIDLATGVRVPAEVYVAAALGVIALGLVIGAWVGRARWLIPIGVLLVIALGATTAVEHSSHDIGQVDDVTATPTSVDEIAPSYGTEVGNIDLDLSQIDFTDHDVTIELTVGIGGNVNVTLPANVDTTVSADVHGGDLQLFDHHFSGLNQHEDLTDLGSDGTGGGKLLLNTSVNFGNVEVQR